MQEVLINSSKINKMFWMGKVVGIAKTGLCILVMWWWCWVSFFDILPSFKPFPQLFIPQFMFNCQDQDAEFDFGTGHAQNVEIWWPNMMNIADLSFLQICLAYFFPGTFFHS